MTSHKIQLINQKKYVAHCLPENIRLHTHTTEIVKVKDVLSPTANLELFFQLHFPSSFQLPGPLRSDWRRRLQARGCRPRKRKRQHETESLQGDADGE
jgi:hypothetical protein